MVSYNRLYVYSLCMCVCMCLCAVYYEHTSLAFTVITLLNACCIINHRLLTGWQYWRGTGPLWPVTLGSRLMLMVVKSALITFGQLKGCVNVCVCVCVCMCVCVCLCVIFYPFGKSPLPVQQEVLFLIWLSHPRRDVKWFVSSSELFRMKSFGPTCPRGCWDVYYYAIVVEHHPRSK